MKDHLTIVTRNGSYGCRNTTYVSFRTNDFVPEVDTHASILEFVVPNVIQYPAGSGMIPPPIDLEQDLKIPWKGS